MTQKKEIIFGAPGCGKTTYLMDVLEKELETYMPQRVAFVSFTKKGANEGLNRAMEKFNLDEKDFHYFRTLHSICFKELHTSTYDMLGRGDYRLFSKAMNMNFVGYYTEDFYHNDDQYLYLYFLKQNNYEMYKQIRDTLDVDIRKLKHVALNYNTYKEQFKKVDFNDLLVHTLKQKLELDIDVAFIDEAQDMTSLQWEVCQQLFKKAKKVYIAGDDDQSLFEWSGSDVNYFLSIEGKRTILKKTWRLKRNILNFSKDISSMIEHRVKKDVEPVSEGGSIHYYNTLGDFEFNDNESYYCLSRNNVYLKRFVSELKKQARVFTVKGKPSVNKDILFAINHYDAYRKDELALKDKVRVEKHVRKDITSNHLKNYRWFEALELKADDSFYYRQLIKNKVDLTDNKITVSTIHGSKGGEADNVVLLLDVTKTVGKHVYEGTDSELRTLYVACTRAKQKLHFIHSNSKYTYYDILRRCGNEAM